MSVYSDAEEMKDVSKHGCLLKDFHDDRVPNLQLGDLADHVLQFCHDSRGSR